MIYNNEMTNFIEVCGIALTCIWASTVGFRASPTGLAKEPRCNVPSSGEGSLRVLRRIWVVVKLSSLFGSLL